MSRVLSLWVLAELSPSEGAFLALPLTPELIPSPLSLLLRQVTFLPASLSYAEWTEAQLPQGIVGKREGGCISKPFFCEWAREKLLSFRLQIRVPGGGAQWLGGRALGSDMSAACVDCCVTSAKLLNLSVPQLPHGLL